MCFVYPQKPSTGNFGCDRAPRLSSAEANQRLSEYTISTHNGIHRKKKKKGAKKKQRYIACLCLLRMPCGFPYRDFVPCLSVLIWLSPGPKEKPLLMVLQSPFFSSSTVTSVAHSSLDPYSLNLKPGADNRSSSKAACTGKRGVGI